MIRGSFQWLKKISLTTVLLLLPFASIAQTEGCISWQAFNSRLVAADQLVFVGDLAVDNTRLLIYNNTLTDVWIATTVNFRTQIACYVVTGSNAKTWEHQETL